MFHIHTILNSWHRSMAMKLNICTNC
jgi:hypothetical protein